MINLRQFDHFVAVLENGSLLGASNRVSISQPALSKSIIALERYYGVELFKRVARGVQPTVFALALEPHARRMLRDMSESRAEMDAIAAGSSGRISVGVGASFVHIVSDTIDEFSRRFPQVQFTVTTDHANNLRQALLSNRIDCYLGMANKESEDSIFDVELMFADAFVGICSPDHPFVNRVIRPDQLQEYEWIIPDLEEPGRATLDAYFMVHNQRKPKVKITTNADHLIRHFLTGTHYLSVTPRMNISLPQFRGFGQFTLQDFNLQRKVGIVRRAGLISVPLTRSFTNLLGTRIRAVDPNDKFQQAGSLAG